MEAAVIDRSDEVKTAQASYPDGVAEADASPGLAKVNLLTAEGVEAGSWYDVKCGDCGNRCCSPCTADGDIGRCAQTRFRNCAVCGHLSSNHYRVNH